MKKNLTGPAWFLLAFGLLYSFGAVFAFRAHMRNMGPFQPKLSPLMLLRYSFTPALFLIESIVYWLIRRYNNSPRASWAHCLLQVMAYWIPALLSIPQIMHRRVAASAGMDRNSTQYLLWGLLLISQIFFVVVLIRYRSNKRKPKIDTPNSENLLDDVVL
jgi:hypothetical protein